MHTINLHNSEFTVRQIALDTIKTVNQDNHRTIQEMLCIFLPAMGSVHTDEYALAIAVMYPASSAWGTKRAQRCAADVNKYNKGAFACQEDMPEDTVQWLDKGTRKASRDTAVAEDALSQIEDQLS